MAAKFKSKKQQPDRPDSDDLKWLNRIADTLDERFDSVVVLVTRRDITTKCRTIHFSVARGNYYAKMGQIREYLAKEDEASRMEVRDEDDED